jgi:excisionase family DNA binding protein
VTETIAYTIDGAAQAAGLGRTTIYELIGAGKIEARKAGGRTLIPAASLRGYLDSLPAATITTGATRRARLAAAA